MTDLEKLIELLNTFRIHYIRYDIDENNSDITIQICKADDAYMFTANEELRNELQQNEDVVDGYIGFYTDFEFTKDGNFIKMGAWE